MSSHPDRRVFREVQFSAQLWDSFETLSQTLQCSVDHLLGEAMRLYLHAYEIANTAPRASAAPPAPNPAVPTAPTAPTAAPMATAPAPTPRATPARADAPARESGRKVSKSHRPTLRDDQQVQAQAQAQVQAHRSTAGEVHTMPEMPASVVAASVARATHAESEFGGATVLEFDPPPQAAPPMPTTAVMPAMPVAPAPPAPPAPPAAPQPAVAQPEPARVAAAHAAAHAPAASRPAAPAIPQTRLEIPAQEIVIRAHRSPSVPPPPPAAPAAAPLPPASLELALPRARLFVYCDGREYRVDRDEFVIGRGQKICDLVIPDTRVSRQHARVVRRGAEYWIVDEQSTSGIEFNGARVREKRIDFGDRFLICGHELRFEMR